MNTYPNASSITEVNILEKVDDPNYNNKAYQTLLGNMMLPFGDEKTCLKVGKVRERYAKGDIDDVAYMISLDNVLPNNELSEMRSSLRNMINEPTDYNIAKFAETDVACMRNYKGREKVPNTEIASAITHKLYQKKTQEDVCFKETYERLDSSFRNIQYFLDPNKKDYIREAFLNNPEKAKEISGGLYPSPKEGKDHPMIEQIGIALEIQRNYMSKIIDSPTFDQFPNSIKQQVVGKLAASSNTSLILFGDNPEIDKDLEKAFLKNKEIRKSINQSEKKINKPNSLSM